jgi:hypothetical protein
LYRERNAATRLPGRIDGGAVLYSLGGRLLYSRNHWRAIRTLSVLQSNRSIQAAIALGAALLLTAGAPPHEADGFRVVAERDAKLRFTTVGQRSEWAVTSPRGIGSATIERAGAACWPEAVVLRMHLKGLETLRVSNGRVTLEVAASSARDGEVRASLRSGKREQPIGPEHPYWPKVRITDPDGNVPFEGGHFEITLPPKLFEDDPERITLQWIDFYRG